MTSENQVPAQHRTSCRSTRLFRFFAHLREGLFSSVFSSVISELSVVNLFLGLNGHE